MTRTSVSIITPVFNRERYLSETIRSVVNQTFVDWELLLIDDGSTDGSISIINEFTRQDARVKLFTRERNPKGACTCRNMGVEAACGDYILFLDSDDLIAPFCLQQRVEAMAVGGLEMGIFPTLIFKETPYDLNKRWNIEKDTSLILRHLYLDAICQTSGALIKTETALKFKWGEDISMWQDIDYFLKLYINGVTHEKFFDLKPDMFHRIHESLSRKGYFELSKIQGREKVYKNTVTMLQEKRPELLSEAKYMGGEVISSYIRSHHFKSGADLIRWSKDRRVLTNDQVKTWDTFLIYTKLRVYKLSFLRTQMEKRLEAFRIENTIGKYQYNPENQKMDDQ